MREFILERDSYRCRYCGTKKGPFHLDHVYPASKGGITSTDNLVTSCEKCNRKKSAHIGIWPKPIGYFEKRNKSRVISSILYLISILLMMGGILIMSHQHAIIGFSALLIGLGIFLGNIKYLLGDK